MPIVVDKAREFAQSSRGLHYPADIVEPHVSTKGRKYPPATISGPQPGEDPTPPVIEDSIIEGGYFAGKGPNLIQNGQFDERLPIGNYAITVGEASDRHGYDLRDNPFAAIGALDPDTFNGTQINFLFYHSVNDIFYWGAVDETPMVDTDLFVAVDLAGEPTDFVMAWQGDGGAGNWWSADGFGASLVGRDGDVVPCRMDVVGMGWNFPGTNGGWYWEDGQAKCDGTQSTSSNLRQLDLLEVGKTYEVTYTVTEYTAGRVRMLTSGGAVGTWRLETGTFTEIIVATGTTFQLQADSAFIGAVDNVVVSEMGVPWEFPGSSDGWSIDATRAARKSPSGANDFLRQVGVLEVGKQYEVTFEIVEWTAGNFWAHSGAYHTARNGVGVYTEVITAAGANFSIVGAAIADGVVDNVRVVPVT